MSFVIDKDKSYDVVLFNTVIKNVKYSDLHEVFFFKNVIDNDNASNKLTNNKEGYILYYEYAEGYCIGLSNDLKFIDKKIE